MNPCERCIWASPERDGHVRCTPSQNDDCGRKQRYQEGLVERKTGSGFEDYLKGHCTHTALRANVGDSLTSY